MKQPSPLDVGLDVHQDSIAVASVGQDHGAEVVSLGHSGTRPWDLEQLSRRLPSNSPPLVLVDEAGPWGSWRYRSLTPNGHVCGVVAPSLLPTKPGERVKTNRRDAIKLALLMRSGDLTPVYVPKVEEEAIRDLCRARDAALRALKTAKVRLQAVLLRPEIRDTGWAPGGPALTRGGFLKIR